MRSQFMDYYGPAFGECLEKWNYLDDLDVGYWNPTEYAVYEPTPLVVKIVSLCVWAAITLWFAQQSRRVRTYASRSDIGTINKIALKFW